MSLQNELYTALQERFPGKSDKFIGNYIGVGNSSVSKLKHDYGNGVVHAKWLAEDDPKHTDLYHRALKAADDKKVKANKNKRTTNKKRKAGRSFDISKMSTHAQNMCGYVESR